MNEYKTILLNKINRRDARVAVIGLGYVGLAVALARAGFRIVGIDLGLRKFESINAGRSYIQDMSPGRCEATWTNLGEVGYLPGWPTQTSFKQGVAQLLH